MRISDWSSDVCSSDLRVILHVEGFGPREFDARIARINPTAQSGTRSIPVFVLLRNPDLVLRGGMFGTGEAVLAEVDGAIAMPADAVRREKDETVVYVLAGDKLERRKGGRLDRKSTRLNSSH